MLVSARAGLVAALVTLLSFAMSGAGFAQKAFQRDDLADMAIKLEAQIKSEAGPVTRSAAALRKDAEAAFQRNDYRSGLQILSQLTVVAPEDASTWLRLARTVLQIRPGNNRERTTLLERAATAAYIAYQRTKIPAEEADSLLIISRSFADRQLWRPALDAMRISLDLREVADVRAQYERLRETHGFRLMDYSVDADAASPRACFQFSEDLPGRRTDLSPFVAVAGLDRPALTVDTRQLCVEGLKHGERYTITLRAGIPSVVRETLAKTAEFNIYVRDRKPLVRFSSRAYVLPRTGQRGVPVISVNTNSVAIEVYRIGDRNLLSTVLGYDFQRSIDRYDISRMTEQSGLQVWKGEMAVEQTRNADVTTAFPVSEAVPNLAPGVYVMVARAAEDAASDDFRALATQWFIVSDLGLTAYSGNDGVHAFVHSLETAAGSNAVEVRLISRANEVLATKRTNSNGYVQFEAALTRGEGAASPAMVVATDAKGDYAFLSLKSPAFDSERPRRRGPQRDGRSRRLRLHRARCLPLRRARACHGAAARCTGLGGGRRTAHARSRAAGRRRIPARDGGRSGAGRAFARSAAGGFGADRHLARARLRRSARPTGGRDHLHGRGLRPRPDGVRADHGRQERHALGAGRDHARRPLSLRRAGRRPRAQRRGRGCGRDGASRLRRLSLRPDRRAGRDHAQSARRHAGHRC